MAEVLTFALIPSFFFFLHISRGRADRKGIKMRSDPPHASPAFLPLPHPVTIATVGEQSWKM